MRVIEQAEFHDEEGSLSLQDRIRGTLTYGFDWFPTVKAQEIVTGRLQKTLSADSVLIRNLKLPRTEVTIPMLLLSPQGVRVIIASPLRGVFRAKGEDWQTFNNRSRSFRRARPNLQEAAVGFAQAVQNFLKARGYELSEIEPILMFSNPLTHVDTVRPRVRVVQRDGIDHFAANLLKLPAILDSGDIRKLTDLFLKEPEPEPKPEPEPERKAQRVTAEDLFEIDEPKRAPTVVQPAYQIGRFRMTRNQWILLGVLGFFNLIIILALAALILSDALFA